MYAAVLGVREGTVTVLAQQTCPLCNGGKRRVILGDVSTDETSLDLRRLPSPARCSTYHVQNKTSNIKSNLSQGSSVLDAGG